MAAHVIKGVLVTVTGRDLECARAWGAECERRVRGENPSGFSVDDRYFKSFLGQLAWLRWCRIYGLRCRYKVYTAGWSVHGKFNLFAADVPKPCEIKTAGFVWHKQLQVPVSQGVEADALYVAMRVQCEADTDLDQATAVEVECCGVVPGELVATLPAIMVKVPTRCYPLTDVGPLAPVRNTYDQGGLELLGRAVELESTPPLRLT